LRMLLVKGSIAATRNEPARARAIADQMLEIDPANEGGTILLARSLLMAGDRAGAIATMEASIAKDGESVQKLMVLLDLHAGRNDFRNVARTFARLFTLEPDNVTLRLEYAKVLYEQGKTDRALEMLARLTRAHPGDRDLEQGIVDIWNEIGSAGIDLGRVRRFVAASGDDRLKIALGHLLLDEGSAAEAEAMLRPFVDKRDISVTNVEADVLYAGALSRLGRGREALALIDRVLAFDRNHPRALLMRVRISIARNDLAQALRDAQLLTRDNPDMVDGRLELARIYILRKEPILADKAYALAMSQLSADDDMLAAYVDYQIDKGRPAMARDAASRFTRENPRSREGWRQRASLCIDARDGDCVAQSFSALAQIPGGPQIRRKLEEELKRRGDVKIERVNAPAGQGSPPVAGR
ncbi:MAG: tetratricopeptide repeat protein, partial [Sphingomonadales bacterium]